MSEFNIGDKVIHTATQEKGVIIEVYPRFRGRQLYKVRYADRDNDEMSNSLQADIDQTDPFMRCRQNYYSPYREYLKDNTSFKISSSNNSTISSLKASKTLFRPYQFKPLMKFLSAGNKRILIADEVGLGKTIEAGHIMLELKARGELKNALVICPVALREKWATELGDKFGLDFMEVSHKDQLLQELQNHNGEVRAVINYDNIRDIYEKEEEDEEEDDTDDLLMDEEYFEDEGFEDISGKGKKKRKRIPNKLISYIQEKKISFSIIICDESHKLRNDNTLVYKGAERLLLQSDSVVFMSATPIMINESNLYNQLHLLDNNTYNNKEIFLNNIQLNRPFVHALAQLKQPIELKKIGQELADTTVRTLNTINERESTNEFKVDEYFKEYPVYKNLMSNLMNGEDTPSNRAVINRDLAEMSPMSSIFSRTRKREVTQDMSQAERNPHTIKVTLTQDEHKAYAEAINEYEMEFERRHKRKVTHEKKRKNSGFTLGLVSVRSQLASSVWAQRNTDSNLEAGYDKYYKFKDAKFDKLLEIMQKVFEHSKKLIIFARFKKTLKYLKIRLESAGYRCAIMYGGASINKHEVLEQFQNNDQIQILLSSEVGSEGLDMQFCNSMVNYDLPWNPMIVEQRIGRIDRFGQESQKVNIYNLIVAGSILEEIYLRLLNRIGIFRESIGDLEVILDSVIELNNGEQITVKKALANMEQDFYSENLTEEEIRHKEEEITQAIANEKLNLKQIEKELTNSFTNDSYFRDEINKIVNNNAYVTENELKQFIIQIMKEHLTTCELVQTDDQDIYEIRISRNYPNCVRKFLIEYEPVEPDGQRLFRRYEADIEGRTTLRVTFHQERAFKDKQLDFINIYHPLIQACVKYFEKHGDKAQCTFSFELRDTHLPQEIKKGRYMLAVYKITSTRQMFGKEVVTESLYPILYDIDHQMMLEDHELAEKFLGRTAIEGQYAPLDNDFRLDAEVIEGLRYDLKECIDNYMEEYRHTLQSSIENSQMIRYQQTMQYYDLRIESYKKAIKQTEFKLEEAVYFGNDDKTVKAAKRTLSLQKSNLKNLKERKTADLEKIRNEIQLKVTEGIKSLNLIKVI